MYFKPVETVFLCRTPLQARICLEIIKNNEIIEFDLVYFTQNNSESDKKYFLEISSRANKSAYIFVKKQKKDILNHILSIWNFKKEGFENKYLNIYIASIDSLLFRFILKKNPQASIYGFDDGTANITQFSSYHNINESGKTRFYNKLFGISSINNIKSRILRHYTIYSDFCNIVSEDKLCFLNLFDSKRLNQKNEKQITYFIGQPFHEYLALSEISKLKSWLIGQSIDYYVMHPRETTPLLEVKLLNKEGMIAEDAIFKNAGESKVRIISAYSTVLFNISSQDAEKIYISLNNSNSEIKRRSMIEKTGSKIIEIL
jgi:beta-galactosamide-alpha-2,3-sialyltransferase